ncbi:MAG: hypothetical protein N3E37_00240 [Candidatus Micrarchaeota archaeon]|nr:hypothetical protein [Candidatus Micrarchaeota archaeon]
MFVSFSLGYLVTREHSLLNFGYGLALLAIIGIIFNLVKIPITWELFLVLGILATFVGKKLLNSYFIEIQPHNIKSDTVFNNIIIGLLLVNSIIYYVGATNYLWYEDGDPWGHAIGVYVIKENKSFSTYFNELPIELFERLYIEPYPPGYDILLALLAQINNSIMFTLKFYNAFLVAYTLIPAYFLFLLLSKDLKFSVFATFVLLMLPAYMSHFIWAQTLAMTFFLLGLYSLAKVIEDKKYVLASIITISALALTQPSVAVIFVPVAGILVLSILREKGFDIQILKYFLLIGFLSLIIPLIVYWIPTYLKFGFEKTLYGIGLFDAEQKKANIAEMFTHRTLDTSGGFVYTLDDFINAKEFGKIDQHIGIGIVASILLIIGFVLLFFVTLKNNKFVYTFVLLFFIFSIIGVQGNALPVKLFPHRFWVFFAIPSAFIIVYATFYLLTLLKNNVAKTLLVVIIIILIGYTSGLPKYKVQTDIWPPYVFKSDYEIDGYGKMMNLTDKNSRIFSLCNSDSIIVGYERKTDIHLKEHYLFKKAIQNKTVTVKDVDNYVKFKNYTYVIIDTSCISYYNEKEINNMLNYFFSNTEYTMIYNNPGFFMFKRVR